jgi:hypothetical protein
LVSTLGIWATIDSSAVVTANSSATYLPANFPEYFGCSPGLPQPSTSSGYVVVTEMT